MFRRSTMLTGLVAALVVATAGSAAVADVIPAIGGDDLSPTISGMRVNGETLGWVFTATHELEITALGFIDIGGDGFCENHALGLWNADGELITSTSVPRTLARSYHVDDPAPVVDPAFESQYPLVDDYRYASIDPIRIMPGQTYVIGATVPINNHVECPGSSVQLL